MPTVTEFTAALKALALPAPGVQKMLRAHYRSTNHTSIARELAAQAGYKNWRGVNLQYGLLANRIGRKLKITGARLSLLVEFGEPGALTNQEWLIFMRKEFARALKKAKWV